MLWRGYLAFYETVLDDDIYHTTFARLIDPARAHQNAFVAEADGRRWDCALYLSRTTGGWDVTYLQDLYADPVRGTGVGRKLIEAV